MSYYGISTLIIIVTSLVAFYLLYKAKELNLGILFSILLSSIILGVTFHPVFKTVMVLLKDSIYIDKSLAFIVSVLAVLVMFLIFILIISLIVSLIIPNKFISIDCCAVIDMTIAKFKYNKVENILEKSVDTEQKIDTMGIEKNQEVISSKNIHNFTSDEDKVVLNSLDENVMGELIADSEVPEEKTVEINAVETQVPEQEILEISILESKSQIPAPEAKLNKSSTMDVSDAKALVLKALQKKSDNKKEEAIECYMKALQLQPDSEMILWIVLDVCALYKQLGLNELAISILNSLASQFGTVIKPEVKKKIMNCLI